MDGKIALFLPYLGGGGAERAMITLASGIADEGKRVDLVLGNRSGPLLAEVSEPIHIVDLHASRTAGALLPLARYLRAERPRVLVSTLNHASIVALIANLLNGCATRVIVREASTFSREARGALRWIVPLVYRLAHGFVAVSEGVAEDLVTTAGVPPEKVRTIYNPVLSRSFFSMSLVEVTHPWFASGEPPVILGVGRLSAAKDFGTLVRAFALVRRRRSARLMILGEGGDRGKLQNLAVDLGVSTDVCLTGFVPNPFPYMRCCRVFVLSSAWEGLPNVLIQAIALGCPVVATDCQSGPREICDGVNRAVLVPVGAPSEMAAGIESALAMPPASEMPASLSRFEVRTATKQFLEFSEAVA